MNIFRKKKHVQNFKNWVNIFEKKICEKLKHAKIFLELRTNLESAKFIFFQYFLNVVNIFEEK